MSQTSHFLVSISGVELKGLFQTKTGGNPSTTANRDFDGGAAYPTMTAGRVVYDDLKIGRRYDVGRDAAAVRALQRAIGSYRTVTVQPTDANYKPTGVKTVYGGLLTAVTSPDVDSNGTANAKFELTLAVQGTK